VKLAELVRQIHLFNTTNLVHRAKALFLILASMSLSAR
jgi:hypothetical protein